MKKYFLWIAGVVILGGIAVSLVYEKRKPAVPVADNKISVIATIYPLAEFARMAAGDMASVSSLVPAGVEPHEYEPTPRDLIAVEGADVFIINGAGIDPWAKNLLPTLKEKGVTVIDTSLSVELIPAASWSGEGDMSAYDPHFWLDPVFASRIVRSIADTLSLKDPSHKSAYEETANASIRSLEKLDAEYKAALVSCAKRGIITSHDAFAYLGKRYGFDVHSIAGISPEAEPSAEHLAELITLAKKDDIRYIFFETLVSPKVSETLAREIGAQTLVFNPIEGLSPSEVASGKNYVSVMEENLKSLSRARECK